MAPLANQVTSISPLKWLLETAWDSSMVFRLEKTVTIKVWQIGLLFRLCQLAVIIYLIVALVINETWAYTEIPVGIVNAYAGVGDIYDHVDEASWSSLAHCSDPAAFSYANSPNWVYDNPACVAMDPWELSSKGTREVHVTTSILEVRESGWPCAAAVLATAEGNATAATARAVCASRGGTVLGEGSSQCRCRAQQTLFPVGIEQMSVTIEHAVGSSDDATRFADVAGSSSIPEGEEGAMEATVHAANGSVYRGFGEGAAISLRVHEWLEAAGVPSLDAANTALNQPDYRDGATPPRYRTTGLGIDLSVEWYNNDPRTKKPGVDSRDLYALVNVKARADTWAGEGPAAPVYTSWPEGRPGAQSYDKVLRYRQGVAFRFRTAGMLYKLDLQYLVNVFIGGLVLLAAAKAVASFVALYCMPGVSTMIKNRTREVFDVRRRFAEIGMKAACAVPEFDALDDDMDGVLEVNDLVVNFALLSKDLVNAEQAIAVAKLVTAAADDDTDPLGNPKRRLKGLVGAKTEGEATRKRRDDEARQRPQGVDFSEFLVAREGGKMITFAKYLDLVTSAAKAVPTEGAAVEEWTRLFEEKRALQEKKKADYQAAHPPIRSAVQGATTAGPGASVDEPDKSELVA